MLEWVAQGAGSGTVSGSHFYTDDVCNLGQGHTCSAGDYVVTVEVRDDDGGVGSDTLLVDVSNANPVVSAGAYQAAVEGATVTLDPANFSDAGEDDTHTATVEPRTY